MEAELDYGLQAGTEEDVVYYQWVEESVKALLRSRLLWQTRAASPVR
jgi:hypothetical protein